MARTHQSHSVKFRAGSSPKNDSRSCSAGTAVDPQEHSTARRTLALTNVTLGVVVGDQERDVLQQVLVGLLFLLAAPQSAASSVRGGASVRLWSPRTSSSCNRLAILGVIDALRRSSISSPSFAFSCPRPLGQGVREWAKHVRRRTRRPLAVGESSVRSLRIRIRPSVEWRPRQAATSQQLRRELGRQGPCDHQT
jgi:hypothetical protein